MIRPAPRQAEQGRLIEKKPCWNWTWPRPPHCPQTHRAAAFFRPAALAFRATFHARETDLGIHSEGGVFEINLEFILQIRATTRTAPSSPSEQVSEAEKVAENIRKIAEIGRVEAARARTGKPLVPVAIIAASLVRVAENAVGLRRPLELVLGLGIPRIAVGVMLHRQLAVGVLNLLIPRVAWDAELFVVVLLFHR